MAWFKVDDQLAFNSKVMLAGNSAMGLWVRAGSWSSAQLTGGFIPTHMANAMANAMANPCDADALVNSGLWHVVDGGYQFHDWTDFQPDAEAEKEKRKATSLARSLAGKAGAASRWGNKGDGKPIANAIANEWQTDAIAMAPTRPDPTRPLLSKDNNINESVISDALDEGTTIAKPFPNEFLITEAMKKWAAHKVPGLNLAKETQEFVTYWQHGEGKGKKRKNWVMAWQNRMRTKHEWLPKAERVPKKVKRF